MGKLARISLSTSKLRFGGGRYGRIARQAMREHVDARETNRILLEALNQAGIDKVPSDREDFIAFFRSALVDVIRDRVDENLLVAIRDSMEAALKPVGTSDSGVQRKLKAVPMRLVLVGVPTERADAFEAEVGDHQVVRVRDILEVMGAVTDRAPMAVVLDPNVAMIPAALRMLAKVLPTGTRVLQWGGQVVIDRPDALAWERLDPSAGPEEAVRRCLRENWATSTDEAPTILVVDDNESWRVSLTRRLTSEGYTVIGASDGAAGLRACIDHKPDLVLSDFDMPHVDGGKLAGLIRQRLAAKAPPFLLITSSDVDARDLPGVIASYPKGHNLDRVLRRIQRLLRKRASE